MQMDLLLATRNPYKTREFRDLLGYDFEVQDLSLFPGITLPEENGRTFAENAELKAVAASQDRQSLVIADDSGLEVDALGGAPGIYSARYAGPKASARNNIEKLLNQLRTKNKKWSARFCCVIALARNGELIVTFEGAVEGVIVDPPRGEDGFGYDPIFLPNGFEQTFAEMAPDLKNRISHRGKAIAALHQALKADAKN